MSGARCGFVALAGWTNVGKSTLLNRLVGQKVAAVADAPQTTRSRITGVRTVEGKGQAVFLDTPGFHRPRHRMNRAMVGIARQSLASVDLALLVVDAARGIGSGDEEIASLLRRAETPSLGVLNKLDGVRTKPSLLPMMKTLVEEWGVLEAIPVSALTGEGCDELLERTLERLPEAEALFPEDYLTDQPERVLAAEWIRESLLRHTREELPHATAVIVERWEPRGEELTSIDASVFVERESQKAIVIGRAGQVLKAVGTEARAEIERLLGTRVFLTLHVKVRPHWRDDDAVLRELRIR